MGDNTAGVAYGGSVARLCGFYDPVSRPAAAHSCSSRASSYDSAGVLVAGG